MREFDTYKAVYCGLCHTLGKRYSFLTRMILTYDATFLALLLLALGPECSGFEKKRCPLKPYGKHACCPISDETAFAADTAVILFFYKLQDNLRDAGMRKKIAAMLIYPFAASAHKKAAARRPQVETIVYEYISAQNQAEKESAGIDEAAHPSGRMMSALFAMASKGRADARVAERMGYFFGRWVYLTDAADDLKKDMESGDYNPFALAYQLKEGDDLSQARKQIGMLLNSCQYEISAAFELLEIRRFRPVVANIVYLGLPDTAAAVLRGAKIRPI